jgi:hypothetical protein
MLGSDGRGNRTSTVWWRGIWFTFLLAIASCATAHHVLGRPAYSLNEDSNTPPSMQVETQIGDYFVTYMVFPAFPRPGERGRVNLYIASLEGGTPFDGVVSFTVRDDSWFSGPVEAIGRQAPDDNVFRQGFTFKTTGDYIVTARFEASGEPYEIDFPLRVGDPVRAGPLGIVIAFLGVTLIGVSILRRKRLTRMTISAAHKGELG